MEYVTIKSVIGIKSFADLAIGRRKRFSMFNEFIREIFR